MALTDTELIAAALADPQAFAAVIVRYQEPLTRYVRRLGASVEDAKDILQESFIRAYVNLNDYDLALPFSAWMYRIAHNETMRHFRKERRHPKPADPELFSSIPEALDSTADLEEELRAQTLSRCLAQLEEGYRDVLVLRYFENKNYQDISDILKMPMGTVATYLARGKTALRQLLEAKGETHL